MKLSLTEENKLLLDGMPLIEGQVLIIKLGEGDPRPGRVKRRPKGEWFLDSNEFVGHTYLNLPLNESWIHSESLVVLQVYDE